MENHCCHLRKNKQTKYSSNTHYVHPVAIVIGRPKYGNENSGGWKNRRVLNCYDFVFPFFKLPFHCTIRKCSWKIPYPLLILYSQSIHCLFTSSAWWYFCVVSFNLESLFHCMIASDQESHSEYNNITIHIDCWVFLNLLLCQNIWILEIPCRCFHSFFLQVNCQKIETVLRRGKKMFTKLCSLVEHSMS